MAEAKDVDSLPALIAPKATPTANPLGMLCGVIARISKVALFQVVFIPSLYSSGKFR